MRRSVFFHTLVPVLMILLYSVSIPASDAAALCSGQSVSGVSPEEPASDVSVPETFSGVPVDAVLVIDVSGSMKVSDPEYLCRSAALTFIDSLSHLQSSRAGLVTFSDTLQKVIPLTELNGSSMDNEVIRELNTLSYTSGDTDIGAAMEKAVALLAKDDEYPRQKSIFLLTDGEIDLPRAENEEKAEKESLTRALMAVEKAKSENAAIHTVALDLSGSTDRKLMNYMADSTGGTASRVTEASMLGEVFNSLSSYTEHEAMEEAARMAETESEEDMAQTEVQTETESETETEYIPAVTLSGTIDGPVQLKGLLPHMCRASLRLSNLFSIEGNNGSALGSIRYTAYSDDNDILKCDLEGDELCISGLANGSARVEIIAEPDIPMTPGNDGSKASIGKDADTDIYGSTPYNSSPGAAVMSFTVQIEAVIPSVYYLVLIPAAGALIVCAVIMLRRRRENYGYVLEGSLQWYVRSEHEKIFGMPSQTMAELSEYGSSLRLSELVHDDLIPGSVLDKVTIRAIEGGIRISSRSNLALIGESSSGCGRNLDMTGSGRFRVFCDSGSHRAVIIAMYTALSGYEKEPSYEDDSDERTRLLV